MKLSDCYGYQPTSITMTRSCKKESKSSSKVERLFCSIHAGVNTCGICGENGHYSLHVPQRNHRTYPKMELFRCGHGMCNTCLTKMESISGFKCPWCRDGSTSILKTFGQSETCGTINTFSEYTCHWQRYLGRAMNSRHPFAILHKQIRDEYKKKKKESAIRQKKEKEKALKKKTKEDSRKRACCHICGRDTFNSLKQLKIHISKKHKN